MHSKTIEPNYIIIKGARSNNLKNISISIPKNKIVAITGVSGSGKSTLAYDTIYAEAQRRYIESLSSYARQFLKKHPKPIYDKMIGLSPAIAIDQKININNSRSTVGTISEIYYFLTILFARIGETYSPISNKIVKKNSYNDLYKFLESLKNGSKIILSIEIKKTQINNLKQTGFSKLITNNKIVDISQPINTKHPIYLTIDRFIINNNKNWDFSLKESYETALKIGEGQIVLFDEYCNKVNIFDTKFTLDNILFNQPTKELFNFNSPQGACKQCDGHGEVLDVDTDKVIPNPKLSIYEDTIHPWRSGKMSRWKKQLIIISKENNIPIHTSYAQLSKKHKLIIWNGIDGFKGINGFFDFLKRKAYKIQYRVMLSKYRSTKKCKECKGSRLKKEALFVKIQDKSINNVVELPISELLVFIRSIQNQSQETQISSKIIYEIESRINILINLGLGYMQLKRKSNSLSGGETQRINIAKSIGSGLIGALYILDEPSIGLHSRDTKKLIKILQELKELGNTIIIVEHDKDMIKYADHIIDIGPLAGHKGGEIIYEGELKNYSKNKSLTLNYINNHNIIKFKKSTLSKQFIKIYNAHENNLKNINTQIPLNLITVITGVSGSGKTTLIEKVLFNGIKRKLKDYNFKKPKCDAIKIDLNNIDNINFISQKSIKTSSKSNPITYVKAFDNIRILYASQAKSKIQNLKPKDFSFNVKGGRCEACKGQGYTIVEMQFMSDISLICENCDGKRYQKKILDIKYQNKNIFDLLNTTIEECYDFFTQNNQQKIAQQLMPLLEVGLGYLNLGQASNTLSSGETQRLKIASFLTKKMTKSILIFDEPTKGLHYNDIKSLMVSIENLAKNNNTVIIIEHNLDILNYADWIIDLGPEGGEKGGEILFSGQPDKILEIENSHTSHALKKQINLL